MQVADKLAESSNNIDLKKAAKNSIWPTQKKTVINLQISKSLKEE